MLFFNKDYIFKYLHIKLLLNIKNNNLSKIQARFSFKNRKKNHLHFPDKYKFLFKIFIKKIKYISKCILNKNKIDICFKIDADNVCGVCGVECILYN